MADHNERDYFQRRLGSLKKERSSFITHWKELSEFIQPRRGRFSTSDRNKGDRRHSSIINSKATQALRIARAGMLAGTMSPSRPWFALETIDPDMMEFQPVKIWLRQQEKLLRAIFNQSNLYNMAPTFISELLLFGTAAMSHVDDFDDVARFYTHTAGSYFIAQNDRFTVDTLVREFEMSTYQLVKQFKLNNVSRTIRNAYDKGNYDNWYPVVHFIEPNPDRSDSPNARNKPFRSVYYEPGNVNKDRFLRKSGFDEFPAYVARWDVTGEDVYGTDCPGMTSLGDVKGLQVEEKRKAQGIDKMVNPPLKGPASMKNVPVSSLPGGLTIYDGDKTRESLSPIYMVNPQLQELVADIERVERRIDTAFFVDMFLAISNMEGIQPRNQLDLSQRNEERLLQLGPVLERIHGEFLDKLIDRTFAQSIRAGIVAEAPQEIQGQELQVKFISTLAMAQKAVDVQGIERVAGYVGGLIEAGFQEVGDKFDADQSVDEYATAIGVPPRVIVSDDVVEEIRDERKKQQQIQQAIELTQGVASAAKDLQGSGDSDISGDTSG